MSFRFYLCVYILIICKLKKLSNIGIKNAENCIKLLFLFDLYNLRFNIYIEDRI